ncbi:mRNA interferase MazF [Ekhidna lutea]|uniref:mRNA interferase n=1 Tax=Ekhidna lutea TaxID=447679 RepID=A0A239IFM2_EKHLU|nr:type II toxin-antitoxin system PemK/MazF family toxin [Ekhidna lutea]SNS92556.1 mRNA interferase MazF [Ekhidna lutea]
MMKKFEVWLANLNPSRGTELGKIRPVLILQNSDLAETHTSTLMCPFSSSDWRENRFRVKCDKEEIGLRRNSYLVLDQIRALDNRRFIEKLGEMPQNHRAQIDHTIKILFDLT